jgi:integrase
MLLTGASCDEARTARWDELDLEARLWRKTPRAASNARPRRISLGGAALLLLEELSGEGEAAAGFLFPCAGGEIPRSRLESVWRGAAAAAGVEHRSLDALRPVLGSRLFDGLPLALTRRLLGLSAARRRHARTGHDAQ